MVSRCRVWPSHIAFGMHRTVIRCRTMPSFIAFILYITVRRRRMCPARISIPLHTTISYNRTWASPIVSSLHTSLSRCWMWPASIIRCMHTIISRCWMWLQASFVACTYSFANVRRSMDTHFSQQTLDMPTHIIRGLQLLDWRRRIRRHCRGLVQNIEMSMSNKNQQSLKHPFR